MTGGRNYTSGWTVYMGTCPQAISNWQISTFGVNWSMLQHWLTPIAYPNVMLFTPLMSFPTVQGVVRCNDATRGKQLWQCIISYNLKESIQLPSIFFEIVIIIRILNPFIVNCLPSLQHKMLKIRPATSIFRQYTISIAFRISRPRRYIVHHEASFPFYVQH